MFTSRHLDVGHHTGQSLYMGTIHFRRRQIFMIFDPYPPPLAVFLLLSVGKFYTPPPPKKCRRLKWMGPYFYYLHWVTIFSDAQSFTLIYRYDLYYKVQSGVD